MMNPIQFLIFKNLKMLLLSGSVAHRTAMKTGLRPFSSQFTGMLEDWLQDVQSR
jgi:hypothetical protein